MTDLESNIVTWMQEDSPPVVAAKVHFALISIHPFEDGNGRTARLLADLVLHRTGWSVDGMISISSSLLARRGEYYEALRQTQGLDFETEVNVTPFVRFHTEALTIAVAQLEERVVTFDMRRDEWRSMLQDTLNHRQVIGMMYMLDLGPLATSTYAKLARCSAPTALSDLQDMIAKHLVIKQGTGRSTRYSADPEVVRLAEERTAEQR